MKKRVWLVAAALTGVLAGGCKSNATEICERLDACHLLPKGQPTTADPNGFGVDDCESQVENELDTGYRDKCADCVGAHACDQIQDACRAVCNTPY